MFANIDVVPESTYKSQIKEKPQQLWAGLLTGPVVYALYFVVGYLLVETACQTGVLQTAVGGLSLYSIIVLVLTLVASLITLIMGLSNFQRWRQHALSRGGDPDSAVPFMIFGSVLLSVFFTSLILLTGIPVLVLQSCRWV
jgi:uncharacterized membrane protein YidH (DUF202 family)